MNYQSIIRNRLGRLRVCTLLALCITAVYMLSAGSDIRPVEAPAGDRNALSGFVVALDPGHGGYDGGARARDSGVWEKALTLQIALEIEKELLARGAQVVMTRREDVCLCEGDTATKARKRQDLQKRVSVAEEAGADVFLSIHMNEYRSRAESGPQVFFQHGGDAGQKLSEILQRALIEKLRPQKQRVAMAGDYRVLRGKLPSALVECGFISNAQEERLLLSADYQQQIAAAIAEGLIAYREALML